MSVDTESTMRRFPLFEMVDRPRLNGGARFTTPVLLPYSVLRVDSSVYYEANHSYGAMLEGGGAHTLPTYGRMGEQTSGRKFVVGEDGITHIHRFMWI